MHGTYYIYVVQARFLSCLYPIGAKPHTSDSAGANARLIGSTILSILRQKLLYLEGAETV